MNDDEVSEEVLMHKRKKTERVARKENQKLQDSEDVAGPTGRQAELEAEEQENNAKNEH